MSDSYDEIDAVQLSNCEVVLSSTVRKGKPILSIVPRKTFKDESGDLRVFIPKRSAIELSTKSELDELLKVLIEIRNADLLS